MLAIANRLGIRVVAEGVETGEQADQLRQWGCLLGQGFHYSRPVDRQTATLLLRERAQKQGSGSLLEAPPGQGLLDATIAGPDAREQVVRYAVLLCGEHWRVVSERRQFGRFPSSAAALQCAVGLAREAMASGAVVEILQTDEGGELRPCRLPAGRLAA
jgi:hypothetical protein